MSTTETLKYPPDRRCRKNICLLALVFGILFLSVGEGWGQCGVGTSTIYSVDFSAAKDTAWTLAASRSGTACVGTPGADDRCIRFNVTLNPGSDLLNFSADQLTGASFYSINCGPLIPIGTPACVVGMTSVCISFCKPGNNSVNYTVTASSLIRGSEDLVLRQNCSGTMSVTGISAASVNWRSIFPDASGAYNSYLSATTGVTTVTVTPTVGAPAYIDYEVSGTGTCTGLRRDTIRIYTVPPMTVNINPATPALCNGASVTLNATVSGGNPPYVYNWNTGATSTGITVSAIGNYSVNVADNTVGCPNEIGNVTVIAAATPAAPTVAGVSICSGSTATLTPSAPGGTYEWFDAASGGNSLGIGASYTTAVLTSNRTYYVQTTVNGCTSTRTAVTVTVNPIPTAPTAAGTTICAGQTASLLATAPGPSYEWYNAPSGGTLLASTAAFNTPVLNTSTTYYVQASNGSCSGARTAVTVTVTPLPAAPTIAGATICSGNTAILTATAPGGTYTWWDAPTNGTQIGSAIAFTTPVLTSDITYYVQTLVNGCVSATRTATTVTVNPTPAAPTVTSTPICGGNTATLNVTSVGDTYRWYNAASGGDLLTTANSYTTPILNANATYYVSATSAAGCTGARTAATVTVTPILSPTFTYASNTFCNTDPTNPSPDYIAPGVTGTFSGSAGLVIDATTGQINLALSTLGPHTVTLSVTSGSCSYTRSVTITIVNNNPDPNFNYGTGQFCVNQANALPTFVGAGSAGVFSGSGINFQNVTTGEINLTLTPPGTYQVINTITGVGGCITVSSTSNITIHPAATVDAGSNLVACENESITLNGIIGGSATSGTWSITSGAGTLANPLQLNTSFTPSGLTSVTLTLTTDDPVTPCSAVSDFVVIDIRPTPAAPSINPATICANTATTLVAFAPGGTYNWYATALGGTALVSPTATFNTGTLTSTTSFFATTTSADNCTSPRQEVIVTVNPLPVVNSAATGSICSQVAQNYTPTATIPGSSFVWSRAAVPNITNAVITGQTTTSITEALESLSTSSIDVVYQIVPTANGCSGAPFDYTVTVKPIPVAPTASSAGAVCVGETISLSTPDRTGATYAWTGPDGFTSALRLPEIVNATVAKDGTYSIRVTVDGCLSPAGTVTQTVKTRPAAPTVSNSSPVCVGDNVTLSTPIVIGASYQWTGPNGYNTNLQNPTITNIASSNAGVYSLALSVNGCIGESSSTTVVVNPIPGSVAVNSTGPVCLSESLNISADAVPLAAYTWTGPNGFVSSVRDIIITDMNADKTGVYQVIVSVAGCPSLANTINATLKPTPAAPTINPISPVCENGTLTLNASSDPTATYTWSGPAGFTSSIQNPVVSSFNASNAGTYVAYVVVDGCRSANNTVNVTMQSLPVVSTLGTNGPVCVGNTLQLNTATITGASYQWTGPNGFASTSQNPSIANVSLNNAGNYSLALSVNGCVGPASSVAATINPLPNAAVVTSTGPVCVTETLRMTANDIPTATYSWTGPNGFISTNREIDIVNMSAATAGAYQVIVSVAGCPSAPTSVNATLKPTPAAPTINPISPVCENGTLTLNASSDPTATYTWTGPAGFSSTAQNPVIPTVATSNAGTYFANVVVNGCRSANNTVNVSVLSLPVVSSLSTNGPVCVGNTLQLNTATVAGASYQWTGPNGYTSTNQNPSINNVSLANAGNYSLALTVNGCVGPASLVAAVINPLPDAVGVSSSGPVCNAETLRITANEVPAGTYAWTGPNGFTATSREIEIVNMNAAKTGSYQVIVSVAGCPSVANAINATLKPTPNAPTINPISPVCENGTLILGTALVSGASYSWSGPLGFISNTQSPVIPAVTLANAGVYSANIVVNGCRSENSTVNVAVLPLPAAPSLSTNGAVCVGNVLQLNTPNVTGASYRWTGPSGFVSTVQNPAISNATLSNAGTYILALTVNGCTGPSDSVVAIVNPLPGAVNINSSGPACQGRPLRFSADSVVAGVYTWTGPNGFTANTREIFFPTMNNATAGTYQVAVAVAGCPGAANSIDALLKPTPAAPIINAAAPICENGQLNLGMNTVAGALYQWTGPLSFTSTAQNPRIDSVQLNRSGIYSATVTVDGCISNNSAVNVIVIPEPPKPTITTNSPVCLGSSLQLSAIAAANASFRWVKTNTLFGVIQSPVIPSVSLSDSGRYGVSVMVNGCVSDTVYTNVVVDEPAFVTAGNDQVVCANNATINLAGLVTGGTNTGIWSTSGTGRFGSRISNLSTTYIPSSQDTAAGTVALTLTATNTGACPAVTSSVLVSITDAPTLDIGNNKVICPSDSIIPLNAIVRNAGGAIWTTTGTGRFESVNSLSTNYILSSQDQASNSFRLRATSTNNGNCLAVTDELVVNLSPAPIVDAGKDLLLYENTPFTLNPTVTGNIRSYEWTPANFLNASNIKNPVFRGNADQTLTLKVTSNNGCVTTDEVFISVAKPFPIPNVFSPNLDGVHDTWVIPELDKYPEAEVSVFDRTGKRVFYTVGYKTPWDGKYEGKYLPFATYYYIIIPRLIPGVFSGSVTILK